MSRRGGDRGQAGGMEVLPLGFLVLVSVTLVIANAWGVIDARMAVSAAAREAVRAYVRGERPCCGRLSGSQPRRRDARGLRPGRHACHRRHTGAGARLQPLRDG